MPGAFAATIADSIAATVKGLIVGTKKPMVGTHGLSRGRMGFLAGALEQAL